MIRLIKKFRRKILYLFKFDYKLCRLHKSKKTVFVCVESAVHNNMGDQALGFCRKELLNKIGILNNQIIDISSRDRMMFWDNIRNSINDSDIILLRGGGCFGNLWEDGFNTILQFIDTFPNNHIILFPQSVYFDESFKGKELLNKSIDIISKRKNIYLFARDFNSYKQFKELYPENNVYVTPDTVLSYKPEFVNDNRKKEILLCLRNDKEKKMTNEQKKKIFEFIERKGLTILEQDTCINYHFSDINERKDRLYELWNEFHSAQIVITDRLHGMIFSAITGTPCIVFDNIDHKVRNAYEWIKDIEYVRFLDDVDNVEESINELLKLKEITYPIDIMFKKFKPLTSLLIKLNGGLCVEK